jgi:putative inorganic carbon (HCO3(-)) transporter
MILYYWLLWIMPLMQHPLWGRKVGPLTLFEFVGLLCLFYACLHSSVRGKFPPILITWEMRLFLLLYVIVFFSALTRGNGIGLSDSSFIIFTSSLLLILITISVVDTLRRLRWTILTLIGSYALGSLYVIREWQQAHRIYNAFRPGWIVGDANYFSTTAIFAIVLAFYFMQGKRPRWERAYCVGCLILTIVALTFCASRGGFLGLAMASVCLAWRTKHRVRNLALISALVLPLSVALPISPLHRLFDPREDRGSTQFHLEAWKAGLRMIETDPLLGVGLGNFKRLMPLYVPPETDVDTVAHNMFIEVAAELGLPALIVLIGIFGFMSRTLGRLRRATATPDLIRGAAAALQAGLLGFAVAGSFVSAEYQKTSWAGVALMACLQPLARSLLLAKDVSSQRARAPD